MDSDPGRAVGMRDQLWNMRVTPRNLYFVLIVLGSIAVFWRSLVFLFSTALSNDEYSHTLLFAPGHRSSVFRALGGIQAHAVLLVGWLSTSPVCRDVCVAPSTPFIPEPE